MRAIQTTVWGQPPTYTTTAPSPPPPTSSQTQLTILATGLHRLTRSQASGQHYSVRNLPLPYTPGIDGVAHTPDHKLVYFTALSRTTMGGAFAEHLNIPTSQTFPLRSSADPVQVAALFNPGMSSWMALKTRVSQPLPKDFTVVILGVTTTSGRVAAHFARKLGAKRVIGVARNEVKMSDIPLDERIVLNSTHPAETDWSKIGHDVDIVLDYLYGDVVVAFLTALQSAKPVQYVNVGSMAGMETNLPSALLRSKNLTMRGSGPGAWRAEELAGEIPALLEAVQDLPRMEGVKTRKLSEVKEAWEDQADRTVFVPLEE